MTGQAAELIGSENTTITYICLVFIHNQQKFIILVLTPIYLLINIAMLISVNKEAEDGKSKMGQISNVFQRFFMISVVVIISQYLVVVQEAELFLKNRIIKFQQK